MSIDSILSSYLHRRGYILNTNAKSPLILLSENGGLQTDEKSLIIQNKYLEIVSSLTNFQQQQLGFLNFLLLCYFNGRNFVVLKNFSRLPFSDQFSKAHFDSNLKKLLSDFANNKLCNCEDICAIFDYFLKLHESAATEKIHVESCAEELTVHFIKAETHVLCADSIEANRAVGMSDGKILLSNQDGGEKSISAHQTSIFAVKFLTQHQDHILCATDGGLVRLCKSSLANASTFFDYNGHRASVFCLDIDSTNQYFVTGSTDLKSCVFNFEFRQPSRVLAYHEDSILCIRIAETLMPGNKASVVTCSADRKVCIWSLSEAKPLRVYDQLSHYPTVVSYHPTRNLLIAGTADCKLGFIDVRNDKWLQVLDLETCIPYALDFDKKEPGADKWFVGGLDGPLSVFCTDFVATASEQPASFVRKVPLPDHVSCCHVIKCFGPDFPSPVVVAS